MDEALYEDTAAEAERLRREAAAEKRRLAAAAKKRKAEAEARGEVAGEDVAEAAAVAPAAPDKPAGGGAGRSAAGPVYYKVTVKDNGKGMAHGDIPNMLGVVLSGTKYGVRQARGKFGLGAKMALICAKQTTGQPIQVRTWHVVGAAVRADAAYLRRCAARRLARIS